MAIGRTYEEAQRNKLLELLARDDLALYEERERDTLSALFGDEPHVFSNEEDANSAAASLADAGHLVRVTSLAHCYRVDHVREP